MCASGAKLAQVERQYGKLPDECRRYFIIRWIIDLQVKDVVMTTETLIRGAGVTSADEARLSPNHLCSTVRPARIESGAEKLLYKNLYYNPVVNEPHIRARKSSRSFLILLQAPFRNRHDGRKRAAATDGLGRFVTTSPHDRPICYSGAPTLTGASPMLGRLPQWRGKTPDRYSVMRICRTPCYPRRS